MQYQSFFGKDSEDTWNKSTKCTRIHTISYTFYIILWLKFITFIVSQIITFMDIEENYMAARRCEISLRVLTAQRTGEIFFKIYYIFG